MKQIKLIIALSIGFALTVSSVAAADGAFYRAVPNASSMKVDGTSSIHDWTLETKLVGGALEFPAGFSLDTSVTKVPAVKTAPTATVIVPSRNLDSGKQSMNNVVLQAMKADAHPLIKYELTTMKPSAKARKAGDPLAYDTTGDLTVAGVKKAVTMAVTLAPMEDGKKLKVSGTTSVKMTDFGIQPPAPKIALGFVSTGDEVKISFDWVTAKK